MVSMDTIQVHGSRMEPDEPWEWLAAGWRDILAGPAISLTYAISRISCCHSRPDSC